MVQPVNGVPEVAENSDDESVETCSTNSLDTVITNCSDDEEDSSKAAEVLPNGPQFQDFIDSMVKNAINSHIKGVKENSRFEDDQDQNPENEVSCSKNFLFSKYFSRYRKTKTQ